MAINKRMTQGVTTSLLTLILGSLALSGSVQAQENWNLRFGALFVDGDQAFSLESTSGSRVIAGGNAALGASLAIEYRFTERVGVELATAFADVPDWEGDRTDDDGTTIGDGPSFAPITASLNIHLTPENRADLYIAPTVGFLNYGDFEIDLGDGPIHYDTDSDVAWGGTIGLDVGIGNSAWALNAAATYLSSDMEISERGSDEVIVVPFDPLLVRLGATVSF